MPPWPNPTPDPASLPHDVPLPPLWGDDPSPIDVAYRERNRVVAAMVRLANGAGCRAWIALHELGQDWPPEWRYVVYVELPTGQVSWHIHERERPLFGYLRLAKYAPRWDGHTTAEKYDRLAAYVARFLEWTPQPKRRRWWRRFLPE